MNDSIPASGNRTPWHLWLVGVLALAWNGIGAFDYMMTETRNPGYMSDFTPEQLAYFYAFPKWVVATWATSVWGGVLGAVLLLLRKRLAVPVFAVSLVTLPGDGVLQFRADGRRRGHGRRRRADLQRRDLRRGRGAAGLRAKAGPRRRAPLVTRTSLSAVERSPQRYARIAGFIYLAIILLGLFGEVTVRDALVVGGDAAATAANIAASPMLWRAGIAGDLLMQVLDVPQIVIFYFLLRPVSESLALLAAFFNLIQTAVLALNKLTLMVPLLLIDGATSPARLPVHDIEALSYLRDPAP